MQDRVQHRAMYLYRPVVADECQFAKFVHEEAHTRASSPGHFRERFLTDIYADRLRTSVFSKMREKQKKAGKSLFAGIKQLLDKVRFDPAVPGQKISS
ncbi:MAG: hypothetical protein JWP08_3175 [Bryobacterales bacterium]|nr:hypothetical protein [Bryobacterales bacterium]